MSLKRAAERRGVELKVNHALAAGGKLAGHASHQQRRGHACLYYLQGGGAFVPEQEIVLHHGSVHHSAEVETWVKEDCLRSIGPSESRQRQQCREEDLPA